jgi:predicted negative regulator of RcsB-dependent stress response
MVSVIVVVAIVVGVGWMVWRRRGRWQPQTEPLSPGGIPPETLAFEAFTHGNTCLAEGKFAEATAAFQQSRELDPKRPHVAERLAEVERRQHAASLAPPASAAS